MRHVLSYWRRVISRAVLDTGHFYGWHMERPWKTLGRGAFKTLLFMGALFVFASLRDIHRAVEKAHWQVSILIAAAGGFLLIFLGMLVRSPLALEEEAQRESQERERQLTLRASTAEARLVPRLRLFTDTTVEPSCFQTGMVESREGIYTLCRVVVENRGLNNVHARVTVRRVPPSSIDRVPLLIAHNRAHPPPQMVEIPANDRVLIDVVDQLDRRGSQRARIDLLDTGLCYAIGRGPLPCEPTAIDIVVGGDVQELVRRFQIEFDADLRLQPLREVPQS